MHPLASDIALYVAEAVLEDFRGWATNSKLSLPTAPELVEQFSARGALPGWFANNHHSGSVHAPIKRAIRYGVLSILSATSEHFPAAPAKKQFALALGKPDGSVFNKLKPPSDEATARKVPSATTELLSVVLTYDVSQVAALKPRVLEAVSVRFFPTNPESSESAAPTQPAEAIAPATQPLTTKPASSEGGGRGHTICLLIRC
jgi:hypothetical protein